MRSFLLSISSIAIFTFIFVSVTPTTHAQSTSCKFRPVAFVIEKGSDGKYRPLRSPNELNWGVIYDKIAGTYGNTPGNYSSFNRLGEFDPCGTTGCLITDNKWGFEGRDDPDSIYDIRKNPDGDLASVSLSLDQTSYKIISQCQPYQKCQPLVSDVSPRTIKNIPIQCGAYYRFGWVVEKTSLIGNGKSPIPNPTQEIDPTANPNPRRGKPLPTSINSPTPPSSSTPPPSSSTPPPSSDSGINVQFIIRNASPTKQITNLYPIVCSKDTIESLLSDYTDSFRIAKQVSNRSCLKLIDKKLPNIGSTVPALNQKVVKNVLIDKNHQGFDLKKGDMVTIGCQYDALKGIFDSYTCPLKKATVGENGVIQNITLTINNDIETNDTPATTRKEEIPLTFVIKNASTTFSIKKLSPIICKKGVDQGFSKNYRNYYAINNPPMNSDCLRLNVIGKTFSDSRGQPDQKFEELYKIDKNYNGFFLNKGDTVMIGCQFEKRDSFFNPFTLCPLVEATVGGDPIEQKITISINNDVESLSIQPTDKPQLQL